ncbi:MAG: DUF3685 domain-containing protein [Gomphosphaeria aponina SAG 52.96 = DSM 107014]|uniref:DUF3685 domain-containing protein n=1 Tax=Gomphosphaeria aponina SAG 52.96 = DSM 107014 TaxID=1521640 RepID=A0A941GPQ9_9CHRO|nr:DUF3685 domain-containing protein [Gomphosphaeria aponina SAG 52.96 = DSM 107014]
MNNNPLKIFIIDDDPIFRLGLSAALAEFADLQVIAQERVTQGVLTTLSQQIPDVVVFDLFLPTWGKQKLAGVQLCDRLLQEYPSLPILLLSAKVPMEQLRAAKSLGVLGYCAKGTPITEIVTAIRQVASRKQTWSSLPILRSKVSWLATQSWSGLQQIEASLAGVENKLKNAQLPLFDWLFWSGRQRELECARWLVNQLVPAEVIVVQENYPSTDESGTIMPNSSFSELPVTINSPESSDIFNSTLLKIKSGLENRTEQPLEIDILLLEKKQELLYLVLKQLRQEVQELRDLNLKAVRENELQILRDIWQGASIDFLSKYLQAEKDLNLVNQVMAEGIIVEKEILAQVGLVTEILGYLVWETGLLVEQVIYSYDTPEAKARAEILVQNLIIKVSNGVMQVVLNNYAESEIFQKKLYQEQYKSSREIAKFRNSFVWKYRQEKYWEEPKNIFEDKYQMLFLDGNKIKKTYIYADRKKELEQLEGLPWGVTMALETRDAIAPRLRSVVDFLGKGLVYILTEVIGRGIGLIGKGIIQGIGNSLQETRMRKNSERSK